MTQTQKGCPLRSALAVLGGKWQMIIIKNLGQRELRFSDIRRLIADISEKVLIDKLKKLCAQGIIHRKDYGEVPPRVSYKLTPLGLQALEAVAHVEAFGEVFDQNSGLK